MQAKTMRAAVYRGVDDIRVETVPVPQIGPGEVLLRVGACGVCGTDLKKIHYGLVPPPRIFGHETAGTIAAVGVGVTEWKIGDRAIINHHVPCLRDDCFYCQRRAFAQCPVYKRTGTTAGFEPAGGGFAEYVRVMDWCVTHRGMARIPDDVTLDEASFRRAAEYVSERPCGARMSNPAIPCGSSGRGRLACCSRSCAGWKDANVVVTDRFGYRLDMARIVWARMWPSTPTRTPRELESAITGTCRKDAGPIW